MQLNEEQILESDQLSVKYALEVLAKVFELIEREKGLEGYMITLSDEQFERLKKDKAWKSPKQNKQ